MTMVSRGYFQPSRRFQLIYSTKVSYLQFQAERLIVDDLSLDHEYLPIEGLLSFTEASARFMLGAQHPVILEKRYSSVQAIAGTGALRVGAELLARFKKGAKAYVSKPTWGHLTSVDD